MKKFLSVMLAVMMVLSTVSFAAPSAFGAIDAIVEAPVAEDAASETAEEADLMIEHDEPHSFSLEFDTTADLSALSLRTGYNNSLGAAFAAVEDGALVLTYTGTDESYAVRDTGFIMNSVSAAANKITAMEMRVKFSGLPEAGTVISLDNGGTRTFDPANFNAFQLYPILDGTGTLVSNPANFTYGFTNDEWQVVRFTADQLEITDNAVTGFRIDAYDYMPHGSQLYIDYIRFEGLKYDTLAKYDVEFDSEDDLTSKVRVSTNNGVKTVTWNEEGYMTIKSVPIDGYTATWDQQIYVETVTPTTALPAGVVDEILVKMRFRNLPTETKTYTIQNRNDTQLNPANMPACVHIAEYGATKWGELLQSTTNKPLKNVVDGQWFVRHLDAETYFAEGMAYVRIDTPYPLPAGVEVDVDYIRFVGDESKVPASEWEGDYGELVLEVDFEDLEAGVPGTAFSYDMKSNGAENGNFIANYGSRVNPGFACSATEIYFRNESGNADIEIKEDAEHGKYVSYTITSDGTSKQNWDLNTYSSSYSFSDKDGYFILTYDYLSPKDGKVTRVTWNRSHQAEDYVTTEGKFANAVANEWTQMVEIYDSSTIGTSSHATPVADITEVNHILIYQQSQQVGETYAIDNVRLWWVPKTVTVQVSDGGEGMFDTIEREVSPTTKVKDFIDSLPEMGTYKITGLSKTQGGELLDEDSILGLTYTTKLYATCSEIETLDGSNEFNTAADLAKVFETWAQARVGTNNAKTKEQQFVLGSDDDASYLKMDVEAASGETGCVVDFGFIVTATPFSKETVKEIVIKMRVKGLPETATDYYCAGHGTCAAGSAHNINPNNCNYVELVYWDEAKSAVKQDYRTMNLAGNEDWFVVTIPAEEFPYDTVGQLRFDPFGDYAPNGASVEVDYIRFIPYPEPELDVLGYSAEFNESAAGVSLVSWLDEDGSYRVDDGVNGDKGPGIGSAYLTDGAPGYITWNEEGYVTLNYDAADDIKAAAAEQGAVAAVYDPSIYIAALDGAKTMPAGAFEELVIRMRIRGIPEDGTAIYGQNYSGLTSETVNFEGRPFYFHYMNSKDAVLYDGVKSTSANLANYDFTKGSYVRDEWFEVTIPASYFEADANTLATLRINAPDWMPDGSKIDIDYIRFMGHAPEADAPVSRPEETAARFAAADEVDDNGNSLTGIRFKAAVTDVTDAASVDIGWVITTDLYWTEAYDALTVDAASVEGAKVKLAYQRLNGDDLANYFDTQVDNENVFAAVLYNIPAANALNYVLVRPFVNINGEYFYGETMFSCLYDEIVDPYITFFEDGDTIDYLIDEGIVFDDAVDEYFEYNEAYYALEEADQAYVEEILAALLG